MAAIILPLATFLIEIVMKLPQHLLGNFKFINIHLGGKNLMMEFHQSSTFCGPFYEVAAK